MTAPFLGLTGPPLEAALIASVGVSAVYVIAVGLMVGALLLVGRVARIGGGAPVGEPALVG